MENARSFSSRDSETGSRREDASLPGEARARDTVRGTARAPSLGGILLSVRVSRVGR